MSKKRKEGKEVTIKLRGKVLESVLKERARREEEIKEPISIAKVVEGIVLEKLRGDKKE